MTVREKDDDETWVQVDGMDYGCSVHLFQGGRAGAINLCWCFGDCKGVFEADGAPQLCMLREKLGMSSRCSNIACRGTHEAGFESQVERNWEQGCSSSWKGSFTRNGSLVIKTEA